MPTYQEFPPIKPTSRSFSPGEYPSTTFESLDGTKTHLRFGNKPVNAKLSLGFSNIEDDKVGLILKNYDDVMSVYDYIKFSDANGSAGIIDPGSGNLLRKEIHDDDELGITEKGLKWRYDGPPQVTSVYPGYSNVECKFVACLDSP